MSETTYLEEPTAADRAPFTRRVQRENLLRVARHVLAHRETLEMSCYHAIGYDKLKLVHPDPEQRTPDSAAIALKNCGTVHCIAGHAIANAGEAGFELAFRFGDHIAGGMLLGSVAYEHFFDDEEDAIEFLEDVVDIEDAKLNAAREAAHLDAMLLS